MGILEALSLILPPRRKEAEPGQVPQGPNACGEVGPLAEVRRIFDAEVVETLPRDEGERQWQERLRRANPARAYLHPWPDVLPGLGPKSVQPFTSCGDCGTGTWSSYGGHCLCLPCAKRRAG